MPLREDPLMTGKIYHVFNKTIDYIRIFKDPFYCEYFLSVAKYYRSTNSLISYSSFKQITNAIKKLKIIKTINFKAAYRVEILSYCLMPNHFHFLLRQKTEKGVEIFISNIENSLTRFFNTRNERKGPIFLPRFHATSVNSNAQLMHVSRYIHLNPYSSGLVKDLFQLRDYPWSSYGDYLGRNNDKIRLISTKLISKWLVINKVSYENFVTQNAEYQKYLEIFK